MEVNPSFHDDVLTILSSVTVDDIVFPKAVVTLTTAATVEEALNTLTNNRILSAPVFDPEQKKFIGFVDYNDVIELIIECYRTRPASGKHVFADVAAFLKDMSLDPTHPFKSVVNISRRNPYVAVPPGTSILQVARMLAEGAAVHRVPVEHDGKVVKIISQSHILGILATNMRLFANVLTGTVADAGLLKSVISVSSNAPVMEALEKIAQSGVSGIAVVDSDTGKMVANLSNSDVRVLLATEEVHYDFFRLTALQLVQVSRRMLPAHPTPEDAKAFPAVVGAHASTPLRELIERLAASRLHRVYITDAEEQPVGIVALKDLLALWIRPPKAVVAV